MEIESTNILSIQALDLSNHTFKKGGVIVDDCSSEIISKDICWYTLPNPFVEQNKLEIGNSNKKFYRILTGLKDGVSYYE